MRARRSTGASAGEQHERQQRQRDRPGDDGQGQQHRRRHQHRDQRRRHGMGEEILDRLDVLAGERDQVAGAAPHAGRPAPAHRACRRARCASRRAAGRRCRAPATIRSSAACRRPAPAAEQRSAAARNGAPVLTARDRQRADDADADERGDPADAEARRSPNRRRHGSMMPSSVAQRRGRRRPARPAPRWRPAPPRRNRCARSSPRAARRVPRSPGRGRRRAPRPAPPSAGDRGRRARISSAWRPLSTTRPWSSTRMRSAPITLDRRCARISVVRPCASRSSACWITASFSASTEDSASSRTRIGESRSNARAIARRWRWPPDSSTPRSPIDRVGSPAAAAG